MKTTNRENVLLEEAECLEIVKKKLVKDSMENYSLVKYEMNRIEEQPGYMGQYFTFKATVASSTSKLDTKILKFFAKIPPPIDSPQYEFGMEKGSFKKEADLYTAVFPQIFRDSEISCIPECFLGIGKEIIVLEDMASDGFIMPDKLNAFDFEHCSIIMEALAKFHAKSIIFEEIMKKNIYDEFSYCLHETLFPLSEGRGRKIFNAAIKGNTSLVDMIESLDDVSRAKFKEKLSAACFGHPEKLVPSKRFRNVICHGDLWANNILFRYDTMKKPVSCCFIDFQLARYNTPAHDILTCLNFTTTQKLRDQHGQKLFKIYYDTLTSSLADVGLDSSVLLPLNDFLDSLEDIRTTCMIHGILNTPIMLLDPQAACKYFKDEPQLLETVLYADRTPLVCEQFGHHKKYKERIQDSLLELHSRLMT